MKLRHPRDRYFLINQEDTYFDIPFDHLNPKLSDAYSIWKNDLFNFAEDSRTDQSFMIVFDNIGHIKDIKNLLKSVFDDLLNLIREIDCYEKSKVGITIENFWAEPLGGRQIFVPLMENNEISSDLIIDYIRKTKSRGKFRLGKIFCQVHFILI